MFVICYRLIGINHEQLNVNERMFSSYNNSSIGPVFWIGTTMRMYDLIMKLTAGPISRTEHDEVGIIKN